MALPTAEEIGIPTTDEIDAYTLQQELLYLTNAAREYNEGDPLPDPRNRIPLDDIKDDKLKLIFSLWQRGIIIPEHLNITYGAPYDDIFFCWADGADMPPDEDDDNEGLLRPVTMITPYILLKHPEQLLGYLLATFDFPLDALTKTGLGRFNTEILHRIGLPPINSKADYLNILANAKTLDLIYIALELDNYMLNKSGTYIGNYTDYYIDK